MGFLKWIQDKLKTFNSSAEADLLFRQAMYQRQQGNLEKAVELFTEALEINSQHVMAYINRGHARRQQGDLEGAKRDYESAYRIDPYVAAQWIEGGRRHPLQGGSTPVPPTQGTRPEPVQGAQNAKALYQQALEFKQRGDDDAALNFLNRVIATDARYAPAYELRAQLHYQAQKWDAAIRDYDTLLNLRSTDTDNHVNRGLMYYFKGEPEKAIDDFTRAIDAKPKSTVAYNNRGTVYKEQGNYDRALADFNRALDLDPQNAGTLLNRGDVYAAREKYTPALDDYDNALYLDRDNVEGYRKRATVREITGDTMGAVADYRRYLDLGGDDRAEVEAKIKALRH